MAVGFGEARELTRFPVEFAAFNNHAAQRCSVSAEKLGGRMYHDIGSVFYRTDEVGSTKSIVHDKRNVMTMRDFGNGFNVYEISAGISDGFDVKRFGFVVDGLFEVTNIVGINKSGGNTEFGQGNAEQVVRTTIERACRNEVVARFGYIENGVGDGRRTGCHRNSGSSAFEYCHPLIDHRSGGIGKPCVNISGISQSKSPCCLFRVVEYIRCCLVNRHGACACGV